MIGRFERIAYGQEQAKVLAEQKRLPILKDAAEATRCKIMEMKLIENGEKIEIPFLKMKGSEIIMSSREIVPVEKMAWVSITTTDNLQNGLDKFWKKYDDILKKEENRTSRSIK